MATGTEVYFIDICFKDSIYSPFSKSNNLTIESEPIVINNFGFKFKGIVKYVIDCLYG